MPIYWPDTPFAPQRFPFFYGWVILAATTLGTLASMPGQTTGVGVYTDPLIDALGLTRTQLATAYMLGTGISSFCLPFAGRLIDRYGARVSVVAACIGLGASILALSQCDRMARAVGGSVLASFTVIVLTYLMLRFFGQGFLTMVSRVAIGKWFNHRRGLATAVGGIFLAFGFNSAPWAFNELLAWSGWRESCFILAAVVGLGMAFLGWLLYRDNPEQCGLVMDGAQSEAWHRKKEKRVPPLLKEFTRSEASRTLAFWVFSLGLGAQALLITAVTFHLTDIGASMGLDRDEAYGLFLYIPWFSIPLNFSSGWLSDHIRLKWILMTQMFFLGLGMAALLRLDAYFGQWLFIIGFGASGGIFGVLITVTFPRYFGRAHLGAISGRNMFIIVFASAIGPFLFSQFHAWTHDYRLVALLSVVMPALVFLLAIAVKNPQDRYAPLNIGN